MIRRLLLVAGVLLIPGAATAGEGDFGGARIRFETSLVLGLDPEMPLGFIADVAVDSNRDILVLDTGFDALRRFSADGEYLGDIGRLGEGPGEYQWPSAIAVDPEDRVYVAGQSSRITCLRPDGNPAGSLDREGLGRVQSMRFAGDRLYLVVFDPVGMTMIDVVDARGGLLDSFGDPFAEGPVQDLQAYAQGTLDLAPDGRILYAQMAPPLLRIHQADGIVVMTVPVRDRKFEVPAGRIQGNGVFFSAPSPAFGPVVALEGGRFLTCLGEFGEDDVWQVEIDLWSPEGERLETLDPDRPVTPLAYRDGMLYAREVREEVPVVVRYAVHDRSGAYRD